MAADGSSAGPGCIRSCVVSEHFRDHSRTGRRPPHAERPWYAAWADLDGGAPRRPGPAAARTRTGCASAPPRRSRTNLRGAASTRAEQTRPVDSTDAGLGQAREQTRQTAPGPPREFGDMSLGGTPDVTRGQRAVGCMGGGVGPGTRLRVVGRYHPGVTVAASTVTGAAGADLPGARRPLRTGGRHAGRAEAARWTNRGRLGRPASPPSLDGQTSGDTSNCLHARARRGCTGVAGSPLAHGGPAQVEDGPRTARAPLLDRTT